MQQQIANLELQIYGTYEDYEESNKLTFWDIAGWRMKANYRAISVLNG